MCDASRPRERSSSPRWISLYAVVLLTVAAAGIADVIAPAPLAHPLFYAVAGAGWVGVMWWIRANRTALEQAEWCACASETITMRVITSEPRQRPQPLVDPMPVADRPRPLAKPARRPLVTASR